MKKRPKPPREPGERLKYYNLEVQKLKLRISLAKDEDVMRLRKRLNRALAEKNKALKEMKAL